MAREIIIKVLTNKDSKVTVTGLVDEELSALGLAVVAERGAEVVGFETNPSQAGSAMISVSEARGYKILASFFNRLAGGRWRGYPED